MVDCSEERVKRSSFFGFSDLFLRAALDTSFFFIPRWVSGNPVSIPTVKFGIVSLR